MFSTNFLYIDRSEWTNSISTNSDQYVSLSYYFHSLPRLEVDESVGWNDVSLLHRVFGSGYCLRITV